MSPRECLLYGKPKACFMHSKLVSHVSNGSSTQVGSKKWRTGVIVVQHYLLSACYMVRQPLTGQLPAGCCLEDYSLWLLLLKNLLIVCPLASACLASGNCLLITMLDKWSLNHICGTKQIEQEAHSCM